MCPLRRIQHDEISARSPLPFAVFDKQGRRLFGEGIVIGSIGYTQYLLGRGLYCEEPPLLAADAASKPSATRRI